MWYTQPGKVRCFEKLKKERLFTNRQLLTLLWPLIIEQALEILVGMADTVMVSSVGEAAISGVSLVDMINQLIITLFGALATGGAAGFSDQERGKLGELLAAGFTDSFRHLHPDATGMYSWWSMRFRARERNAGWRIDYFLVSDRIADKIQTAAILMDVMGSDHGPVELDINLYSLLPWEKVAAGRMRGGLPVAAR